MSSPRRCWILIWATTPSTMSSCICGMRACIALRGSSRARPGSSAVWICCAPEHGLRGQRAPAGDRGRRRRSPRPSGRAPWSTRPRCSGTVGPPGGPPTSPRGPPGPSPWRPRSRSTDATRPRPSSARWSSGRAVTCPARPGRVPAAAGAARGRPRRPRRGRGRPDRGGGDLRGARLSLPARPSGGRPWRVVDRLADGATKRWSRSAVPGRRSRGSGPCPRASASPRSW